MIARRDLEKKRRLYYATYLFVFGLPFNKAKLEHFLESVEQVIDVCERRASELKNTLHSLFRTLR